MPVPDRATATVGLPASSVRSADSTKDGVSPQMTTLLKASSLRNFSSRINARVTGGSARLRVDHFVSII